MPRNRLVATLLAAALTFPAYAAPTLTCKLLKSDEAAQVLGPSPTLQTALEGGACVYVRGKATLTVAQPASYHDGSVIVAAFEAQMKTQQGQPLAGVGDRAYLAKQNSGYQLGFLKGKTLAAVEV